MTKKEAYLKALRNQTKVSDGLVWAANFDWWYESDAIISRKLGFDFNWYTCFHLKTSIEPPFERERMAEIIVILCVGSLFSHTIL